MVDEKQMVIRGWRGCAPFLDSADDWKKFFEGDFIPEGEAFLPACKDIPPMLRRRATVLTRFAAEAYYKICSDFELLPSEPSIVFASEHGEIAVLESLFNNMFLGEALSPIAFCNSVHHTATGYISIASSNIGISRTVSANKTTFAMGILEGMNLLYSQKGPVIVLLAEEPVPLSFASDNSIVFPYCIAFLLGYGDVEGIVLEQDKIFEYVNSKMNVFTFLKRFFYARL